MKNAWTHPQLGSLKYDRGRDGWTGTIEVPGFIAFTHTWDGEALEQFDLVMESADEADTPSPEATALVLKLLTNQKSLPRQIVNALWEDFNGRGPRSGMWWHGDLDQ